MTSALKPTLFVLKAITITDSMLVSTTVPENDYPAYNPATTYAVGNRCISTTTHRIYESQKASNTNHDPTDINNRIESNPWWLDVGPTNRHAMFDGEVSTQTIAASSMTVVIRPGFFNAFLLAGMEGEELAVTVKDAPGGNVIYSYTGDLEASAPADYYEHFYDPFKPQTYFMANDIEAYQDAEITVTVTSSSGSVKVGVLGIGDLRPLGKTQYGAKAKPRTFSYIKIDEYGNNTIKRRKRAKDLSVTAWIDRSEADWVLQTLMDVLDVPCFYVVYLPGTDGPWAYGLGSGEISYDYPKDCLLTVDVQGLI